MVGLFVETERELISIKTKEIFDVTEATGVVDQYINFLSSTGHL
jgi:hypothetical protein